jgi:hypothetical protein
VGRLNDILKSQMEAWLRAETGGRLPGEDSRHVPRGKKIPGESRQGPRGKQFPSTNDVGYDKKQVAAFLDAAGIRLAAMEATDRPSGHAAATEADCKRRCRSCRHRPLGLLRSAWRDASHHGGG